MDHFKISRKRSVVVVGIYALIVGLIVCLGYNLLYFEVTLPNGAVGQILDILDYITNNCFMPLVALFTCILIGWVAKPKTVINEVCEGGFKFGRKTLYVVMVKFVAPVLLFVLLIQSLGLLHV